MQYRPHAYQAYCIQRILTDAALGLYIDMGLGKTVITLTAINDLLYNRFAVSRVLVIAPKKVAEATWQAEAAKWDHLQRLRFSAVMGSASRRIRALHTPADVWVINRENIPWLVDYCGHDWPFDMVVIDESSSFKNHRAKRFKALTWIRNKVSRIVELSGTPAPNSLLDLWAQIYLLDSGQRLGARVTHFRERYLEPDKRGRDMVYSYRPKPGAEDAIQTKISDICVSMQAEDYLDLPGIVYDDVPVVLDDKAAAAYRDMETKMLLQVDTATISVGQAAALSGKLQQLCNGAVYDDDGEAVHIHDCKLDALAETLEQLQGKPALVFYGFRHDLPRLEDKLAKMGLRYRQLRTDADKQAWDAGELDVLLAHPASCAYGLNLQQGGNHIIWFGLTWSAELYEQANRRLYRQGQGQTVIVHHLIVQGGRDEDMIQALQAKGDAQQAMLDSLKARVEEIQRAKYKIR